MAVLAEWHDGSLPLRLGGVFTKGSYVDVWPLEWVNCDHNGQGPAQLRFPYASPQSVISQSVYFRTPPFWPERSLMIFGVRGAGDIEDTFNPPHVHFSLAGERNAGEVTIKTEGEHNVTASEGETLFRSRWYHIEMIVNHLTGMTRARVSHLHSDTPLWTSDWVATGLPSGTQSIFTEVGAVQGSLLLGHSRIAHLDVTDSTTWVGRHSSDTFPWDPPPGDFSQIKLNQGGTLVNPAAVQIWEQGRVINAVSAVYSAEVLPPEPPEPEVGQVLAELNFDDQDPGNELVLSAPWSEAGRSTGTPFVALTAAAAHGPYGARVTNEDGWRVINYSETIDIQDDTLVRVYEAYWNIRSHTQQIWILSTTNDAFTVGINADRTVRIRDGLSTVDSSTVALNRNVFYRISYRVSISGQELNVYLGEETEPIIHLTGPLSLVQWDEVRFATYSASTGATFDIDTIRIGDGWLEPYA